MKAKNLQIRQYVDFLIPSVASLITSLFVLLGFMFINSVASIRSWLSIDLWNFNVSSMVLHWLSRNLAGLLGQHAADSIVLGFGWAVVGLLVYYFLYGLSRIFLELDEDIKERSYVWPKGADRNRPVEWLAGQTFTRMVVGIALLVYVFNFATMVVKYRLPRAFGLYKIDTWWLKALIFVGLGLLIFHGLVILLRLFFLRRRVF